MENKEKIDFEAIFDTLPLETQSAIIDTDIPTKMQEIGLKFGLHVDQMGALFDATQEVALGIANYEAFTNVIESTLGVSRDVARQITSAVNESVFKVIREKMIEMSNDAHEEISETEEKEIAPEETSILAKTGIDLSFATPEQPESPKEIGLNRDSMLSGIENPPKTTPITLNPTNTPIHPLQQKIQSTTISQNTQSDHSLKIEKPNIDPYREIPN